MPLPWSSGVAVDARSRVLLWRSETASDLSHGCGVRCCADVMPTLTMSATAASTTDCFRVIGSLVWWIAGETRPGVELFRGRGGTQRCTLTCWNEVGAPNRIDWAKWARRTAAEGPHVALEKRNAGKAAAEANVDGGSDDSRSRRGCAKEAPTAGERSELPGRLSRPSRPRKRDGHSLVQSRLFNNEGTAKCPHRDIFAMVGNGGRRDAIPKEVASRWTIHSTI